MARNSSIVSGIHSLKKATEYFSDFVRSTSEQKGRDLFRLYNKRIEWIFNDLVTHPAMTHDVKVDIKKEWDSDVFTTDETYEKICLLNPVCREQIENLLDLLLKGEKIEIEFKPVQDEEESTPDMGTDRVAVA